MTPTAEMPVSFEGTGIDRVAALSTIVPGGSTSFDTSCKDPSCLRSVMVVSDCFSLEACC